MGAPEDRVRLLKNESPGTGGSQDDIGFPTQLHPNQDAPSVRGLFIQPYNAGPDPVEDEKVYVTRDAAGNLIFKDDLNAAELTLAELAASAGGGITETQHEALDTLAHMLTETHNVVVTRDGGGKVSELLSEETGGTDIRKFEVLTRSGGKVATFRLTHYAGDGSTIKRQLDVTVNRTGGKVSSMNVVRTV